MDSNVWGPIYWNLLHIMSLATDQGFIEKSKCIEFYSIFSHILPCPICRSDFINILHTFPFPESDFFEFSIMVHNKVNQRLGKQQQSIQSAVDKIYSIGKFNIIPYITFIMGIIIGYFLTKKIGYVLSL